MPRSLWVIKAHARRFKEKDERVQYDAQLAQLLPRLHAIMLALSAHPTPENLLVQKMVLKIVYRSLEVWTRMRYLVPYRPAVPTAGRAPRPGGVQPMASRSAQHRCHA